MTNSPPDREIGPDDKDYPYRRWAKHEDWKNSVHRRGVHKALDLADEMEFKQDIDNSRRSGMGWKELAVIGAMLLGGGTLGFLALDRDTQQTQQPTQQTPPPLYDSEYEVRFYDRDGNPIDVPHISQRPTE